MIKAYINGIEYELGADYSVSEQTANKIASNITIRVDDQPLPTPGDIIEIKDDNATYFLGVCGIPKSPKYNSPHDVRVYSITCNNANAILANRLTNVAYRQRSITYIINDLFDKYISGEGFTLGRVSDIPIMFNIYTAADFNLRFVLDELAEYVQGSWGITADKEFYFIAKDDFDVFPLTVDANFCPLSELQTTVKDTDLRTQQIINSNKGITQTQYEDFVYDGETDTFTVSFPVKERPRIFVNGTEVPPELIGIAELAPDDLMFTFGYNNNVITYNSLYAGASPPPLQADDAVQIRYIGFYSLRVVTRNQRQIAEISRRTGTSGIIDNIENDNSIGGIDDAMAKGYTLLENYGYVRSEAKMWTTVREMAKYGITLSDLALLKKWTFDLPKLGLVGDYVLTERTITPLVLGGDAEDLKITLKFVDRAYIQSYGQLLQTMQKQIANLSVRESDVIVENDDHEETLTHGEIANITPYSDFTPLFCTTDSGGFGLLCPFDIIPYAFSQNCFGVEYQQAETVTHGERLTTNEKPIDTDKEETAKFYEQLTHNNEPSETDTDNTTAFAESISETAGALESDQEEITPLTESIQQTEGETDTDKEETLQCKENNNIDAYTDFVPAYCCADADSVPTSPVGLGLYCFSVNTFGVQENAAEAVATSENVTNSEGAIDTDKEETINARETTTVNENSNFMVLFCTTAAQFETNGQIASPLGLYLYAYSVNGG